MTIEGRIIKYGDNIDTDVIIPARYLNSFDENELAAHCMEDLDPDFSSKVHKGDILVGGSNFGCGSSREHAPLAIKASGIACIIAKDFARIFYRNAINIGLPILECRDIYEELSTGDYTKIDFDKGEVRCMGSEKVFKTTPFPEFLQDIIRSGGLMQTVNRYRDGEIK